MRDVRFGFRLLRRDVSFSAAALFTLAIGIGVTTAVFSVVSGLVLRPLPFPEPDRLVQVHGTTLRPAQGLQSPTSTPTAGTARRSSRWPATRSARVICATPAGPSACMVVRTERDFFAVLGVPALYGKTYDTTDATAGPCVIGETFWRRRFGGAGDIIGRALVLDGQPYTVTGIMPERFQYPYRAGSLLQSAADRSRTDLWMPFDRPLSPRGRHRQRDRPAEARRVAGRGAERVERHRETSRGAVPGHEPGTRHRHRPAVAGGRAGAGSTARHV